MTGASAEQSQDSHAARLTLHYFATDPHAFWKWSQGFEAIVSREGTTISFYQEVVAVLRSLAPEGFPAFDAIALFLATFREGDDLLQESTRWAGNESPGIAIAELERAMLRFHQIVASLGVSAEQKGALAAIVFENCTRALSSKEAQEIVAFLESGNLTIVGQRQGTAARTVQAVNELITGLDSIDKDTIDSQLSTGLAAEIRPAPVVAPSPGERARQLLFDIKDEEGELGGIASVALNLMAAVHIPRAIDEPENLPLGGYSDISNRGAPDRLLITELAQDDEILATRINLNEALYLRREAPPRTPLRKRDIVIDTGVRMWGVSRVFATALGLAFCATADVRHSLRVFRPSEREDGADPVDLFSREGLNTHLGELAISSHPGHAIQSAIRQIEHESTGDFIIITHRDVFSDPAFLKALTDLSLESAYLALIDEKGSYELWRWSRRGTKRLQSARCQLDDILNPGTHTLASVVNPDIDPDLPLALRMREFPLLAAQPLHTERAAYHPEIGLTSWFRDSRVIVWEHRHYGGRILQNPADHSDVCWIWLNQERREILLIHNMTADTPASLSRISLDGKESHTRALDIPPSAEHIVFSFHPAGQLLCVIGGLEIIAYSLDSGQKSSSLALSKSGRIFGRYFQEVSNLWRLITFRDSRLSQEEVPTNALPKSEILRCFDRDGHEGIHVVLSNGSIFRLKPESSLVHKMPSGVTQVRAISRDGHRILYVDQADSLRLLDLNTGRFETIPPRTHHPLQMVEKGVAQFHRHTPSLRKNFRAVAFHPNSHGVALITRNNQIMFVHHAPAEGMIHLQHAIKRPERLQEISFSPIVSPFGEHHSLALAESADGTRLYLDSRGFLHIVPGDPTLPQAALVLKDRMLSGWFSDGTWFGDRYFIGDRPPIDSASAYDRLTHCFQNLATSDHRWKSD